MKKFSELTNEQVFEIARLALSAILDWDAITEYINSNGKAPQQKLRIEREIWEKKDRLEVIRVYIDGVPDTWCAIWEVKDGENKIDVTVVEGEDPADVSNYTIIVKKLMEWNYIEPLIPDFAIQEVNHIREAIKQIKNDPELFRAWKDNIAMSFKDEYSNEYDRLNKYIEGMPHKIDLHKVANTAAENFLNLLCKDPNE
jgi:hypothetical protein